MEYRLGDIGRIVTGKTPSTKQSGNFSYFEDIYMFLTPKDMKGEQKYIRKTERYLTKRVIDNFKTMILKSSSVCISCIGSDMGKVYLIDRKTVTNQQINSITDIKSFCNPEYLYYYFKGKKEFLKSIASGSTMPILSKTLFSNIIVNLPDIEKQNKIVNILKYIDSKIELNIRINYNLLKISKCLYKEYFCNDSNKIGEYKELSNICKMVAGGDKPKNISLVRTDKYDIPIYSNGISNEGLCGYTDKSKILNKSITVSARGTIGYICLRLKPYVPIVRLISLEPSIEKISAEYLFFTLLNENITSTGTTQQQLTIPDFKHTKILVPDIKIMNEYTSIVEVMLKQIEENKKYNETLIQLRNILLSKLMNGEIDLDKIEI